MSTHALHEEPLGESWSSIVARGDDAEVYLQGQLSQDIGALGDESRWSLVLAPDSSVLAAVLLTKGDDGFMLSVPAEVAEGVMGALKRFLLRTKCELSWGDVAPVPFASLSERLDERWPGGGEYRARLTPHSYGARFVERTISFTKGCFTGQELVGRLDARGASVPWRVVYFEADDLERVDGVLRSAGPAGPQGVTTALVTATGARGMGVAHRTLLARDELAGVVLTALP